MQEEKNVSASGGVGVQEPAGGPAESDSVNLSDAPDALAALTAERDKLSAEKADLQDRLLRRQAEFDNFRKRADREKMEILEYAGMDAARAILPVVDDFERALKTESADKEYSRGMELIHQRLSEALKKMGLEPLDTKGQKFDPNLHHGVDKQQTEEFEEDTILEEYQKGYQFKGRLLRPAMVKVAVRP